MLQSLHIQNFILIERLDLDFSNGFNALTGETGSGKSILLDSILFALGQKFNGSPIKPGAKNCSVTLIFATNDELNVKLEELDIDIQTETSELIIKRVYNAQGRNKYFLNDEIVTAKLLQKIFNYLLELHGQHSHTMLTDKASHMAILDNFSHLTKQKHQIAILRKEWLKYEKEWSEFNAKKQKLDEEVEYLEHVCAELEELNIAEGEEQELLDIKKKIQNYNNEYDLIKNIIRQIEDSKIEQVIGSAQKMINTSSLEADLSACNQNLEESYDKLESAKDHLQQILKSMELPEHSIDDVEDRLYEIRTLARKHNCTSEQLGSFLDKSKVKLEFLKNTVSSSLEIEQKIQDQKNRYLKEAKLLHDKRKIAAKKLSKIVMQELGYLDMKKAIFQINIEYDENQPTNFGCDTTSFVASTNPGMKLLPIDKIASGGELSRFMLALRVALFDSAPKQTIIFDEVDVGISGAVADSIGQRLKELSKAVQIIVITHQPQVAGKADQHILVAKKQNKDNTKVNIDIIEGEDKHIELARMISGKKITKLGIEAAKELI